MERFDAQTAAAYGMGVVLRELARSERYRDELGYPTQTAESDQEQALETKLGDERRADAAEARPHAPSHI